MKDWHDILKTCELQNWKEALAAVITYAQPEEFSSLCGQLKAICRQPLRPYSLYMNPHSQVCAVTVYFQTFWAADWRQQTPCSCEPKPASVTSAPETLKNLCFVGAAPRMDTVPCPFRQVYILIPALDPKLCL